MRDRYLERDRGYLGIIGRELGGIKPYKTFVLYVTI